MFPFIRKEFIGRQMDMPSVYRCVERLENEKAKTNLKNPAKPSVSVLVYSVTQNETVAESQADRPVKGLHKDAA